MTTEQFLINLVIAVIFAGINWRMGFSAGYKRAKDELEDN